MQLSSERQGSTAREVDYSDSCGNERYYSASSSRSTLMFDEISFPFCSMAVSSVMSTDDVADFDTNVDSYFLACPNQKG
ncbi:unnamed protein product [Timema podura]|uniref:Uncharacterized protein n=1 Tax=Timema podura TaxID=61482 RepID=A0ABN7NMN3_TIMPD|nr:unnamed protein product [Timema podura]